MFTFLTKHLACGLLLMIFTFLFHRLSAQLIISQYYEGEANDKFLEITNAGGTPVNQSNSHFFICVFSNEDATDPSGKNPALSTEIKVEISPGEAVIYKNSLANNPTYAVDEGVGALIGAFNGNDVIIISTAKDETAWENRIDVIGHGGNWGVDKSFYRKSTVEKPNPDYMPGEWQETTLAEVNSATENAVERLGYHIYSCQKPSLASAGIIFSDVSDTSLDIRWSEGNGSDRLVIAKAGEAIANVPVEGISYKANAMFGSGDGFDGGFVVYNGWENSFSLNNLTPSTQYFISIFEFSCSSPEYLTTVFASSEITTLAPIPRIFTDLEEEVDFGIVRPGESSTIYEIVISWENLKSPVIVTIGYPFEISVDQGNWFNEIVIPYSTNGFENMYLRFSPDKPDGIHHKILNLSTSGMNDVNQKIKGTAFPNAWINEFHYDNIGADKGEFVEIALQNPEAYDLSTIKLQLYNGSSGLVYDQESVDNFIPGEKIDGYGLYLWPASDIQNGQPDGPDGMALGIADKVIAFLSYEGTFTANDGLAMGLSSIDIGVEESDKTTVEGLSLQLQNIEPSTEPLTSIIGYEDFVWTIGLESPGSINGNQVLPVIFGFLKASRQGNAAILSWQTLSELNNFGFEIQKSVIPGTFKKIGFMPGNGYSSVPINYHFADKEFSKSCYYRLKQIDFDGSFSFSTVVSLKKAKPYFPQVTISPNPVRQAINFTVADSIKLQAFDVALWSVGGKKILQSKGDLVKIRDQINHCLEYLQKGAYLLKLRNNWHSEKHILLKE